MVCERTTETLTLIGFTIPCNLDTDSKIQQEKLLFQFITICRLHKIYVFHLVFYYYESSFRCFMNEQMKYSCWSGVQTDPVSLHVKRADEIKTKLLIIITSFPFAHRVNEKHDNSSKQDSVECENRLKPPFYSMPFAYA